MIFFIFQQISIKTKTPTIPQSTLERNQRGSQSEPHYIPPHFCVSPSQRHQNNHLSAKTALCEQFLNTPLGVSSADLKSPAVDNCSSLPVKQTVPGITKEGGRP